MIKFRKRKSILFIRPDYHCSFFYRNQLRKLGWKADIYLCPRYPEQLLYSKDDLISAPQFPGESKFKFLIYVNHLILLFWWLTKFWRYEYHFYYGRPPEFPILEEKIGLTKLFGEDFLLELWLAKLFKITLIYLPAGCFYDESQENFSKLDNGNVCNNCGYRNKCNDKDNHRTFAIIRRYFDLNVGIGSIDSTQFKMTHFKYKSIDLNLWSPDIAIPSEHKLPPTDKIRIMHSAWLEKSGRTWEGRNIKGSPYVVHAIERLKEEGYPVEYFYVQDKQSNVMRFYQAQADIIVDQLIYGWWGSTVVEGCALGKPVICYIRPSWKEFFLKTFPEYKDIPVISATTDEIYETLKKLVENPELRKSSGQACRKFAENHFNPEENAKNLAQLLDDIADKKNA
ncbi:glycosyltransferase [Terasakiella sp.]|uniref:glycosyltransferase n=1 Tax=Terasakiella sp. TaxID=2034861 RepID=UPI003AA8D848